MRYIPLTISDYLAEGKYAEAADAYEKNQDYGAVVRLCVDKLRDVQRVSRVLPTLSYLCRVW